MYHKNNLSCANESFVQNTSEMVVGETTGRYRPKRKYDKINRGNRTVVIRREERILKNKPRLILKNTVGISQEVGPRVDTRTGKNIVNYSEPSPGKCKQSLIEFSSKSKLFVAKKDISNSAAQWMESGGKSEEQNFEPVVPELESQGMKNTESTRWKVSGEYATTFLLGGKTPEKKSSSNRNLNSIAMYSVALNRRTINLNSNETYSLNTVQTINLSSNEILKLYKDSKLKIPVQITLTQPKSGSSSEHSDRFFYHDIGMFLKNFSVQANDLVEVSTSEILQILSEVGEDDSVSKDMDTKPESGTETSIMSKYSHGKVRNDLTDISRNGDISSRRKENQIYLNFCNCSIAGSGYNNDILGCKMCFNVNNGVLATKNSAIGSYNVLNNNISRIVDKRNPGSSYETMNNKAMFIQSKIEILELIKRFRLTWWLQDTGFDNNYNTLSEMLNAAPCTDEKNFDSTIPAMTNSSEEDKCLMKFRAQNSSFMDQIWNCTESTSDTDSNKFSESELDESESSLDGSFRLHRSDSLSSSEFSESECIWWKEYERASSQSSSTIFSSPGNPLKDDTIQISVEPEFDNIGFTLLTLDVLMHFCSCYEIKSTEKHQVVNSDKFYGPENFFKNFCRPSTC